MDRAAFVHRERPVPLVDEEGKSRIKVAKLRDHLLHLPEIVLLDLRVRVVDLVGDVVVKSAQKIVRHRTGIEIPEPAALPLADASIPLEGQIFAIDICPQFFPRIPDVAQDLFPVFVQKLGAVREERHIMACRIEFSCDLFRERGHCKRAGTLSCDQELFRRRKQLLAVSHRRHEILIAMEIENCLVSFLSRPVLAVLHNMVNKPAVSHVHIAGRISNDQEIPVVKRIVGPIFRDSHIDVHDLREQPQIIPIIIGQPRRNASAVHRTGRHILVDGDPAAGEKDAELVSSALPDINMILGAVSTLSLRNRHFIPYFGGGLTDQDGRLLPQLIDSF